MESAVNLQECANCINVMLVRRWMAFKMDRKGMEIALSPFMPLHSIVIF